MAYDWMHDPKYELFDDLNALDEVTTPEQIHELLGDIIYLDRYVANYDYLFNRVVGVAELCWSNLDENGQKLQKTMIKIKKRFEDPDETIRILPLNRMMMSLTFLRPIAQYLDEIDIDEFLLDSHMTSSRRETIQNNIVRVLQRFGTPIAEVQARMARLSKDWKMLMLDFAQADMQIYTAENLFLDHYRDNETIRDINNTVYPPDMQTADIVEENRKRYDILAEIMLARGNPFFVGNKYTPLIKPKQMEELYINFSQIPDGRNIVPVIMNGNGFNAGYHELPVFYTGAIAARVPDMMNKDYMGMAGYFGRNLVMLSYGTISPTVYDCGSQNPIPITLDDVMLDMMDGRYYYPEKGSSVLRVLHKKDKHLLGKKLWFRSPCTCNLNEDCCHICYGQRAQKVADLAGGFIYTTELMTSRVSQNILSAKHLLKSNAEKIVFSDNFDKYFVMEMSTVIPKDDVKRFDIYIREDYMDNISDQLTIYVTKDMIPVTISNYAAIQIPDNVIDKFKDVVVDDVTYYKITSHKILELGGQLVNIIPINISTTKKYMDIMRLFESDISRFETIDQIVVKLAHMCHKLIPILSVHGEILIGHHIRSVDNRLLRPNWLVPDQKYQIMRLKTALQNTESFATAMSFEQTKHHLYHSIFDERNKINRVGVRTFSDYILGEDTL